jgi:hypothetical protein
MKTVWKDGLNRRVVFDVGRNQDCPCGSKMKFKYCCLDNIQRPILRTRGKKVIVSTMDMIKKQMIG